MKSLSDCFVMHNGYKIPCIGYGTWHTPDGETAVNVVKEALALGYRHIDAAAIYRNEVGVGQGILESDVARKDIFVTSKVWNTERGYDKTMHAFEKTMSDLKLDYLDLYLIHWPATDYKYENWNEVNLSTWKALVQLYKEGRIRSIGVSNFLPIHLERLMESEVAPMVNQIEYHPGQMQDDVVKYCHKNNIVVEAWSPLGTGRMLDNPQLMEIAGKYGKSVAQLCLRWCLQNNVLPLPKSITPSRIKENGDIFDFTISAEDMAFINSMEYFAGSGIDHTTFE